MQATQEFSQSIANPKIHEVVYFLKKLFENPVSRRLISKIATPKRIERVLSIYCGVAKASGIEERIYARSISEIVTKAAERFNVDEGLLKEGLKDPYYRRGVANVVAGIAKYGITLPQRLYAPFLVVWNFTKKCNLRCKHCYANAGRIEDELTLEEKLSLVKELDDAGVVAISFSGGEPLISRDFWKVAEYASNLGFHVSVATNGTLITRDIAERLKRVVDYVEISLDAANPETHDGFRGIKGAFEKAIGGIKNCVKAGILTAIATTATKLNLYEIPEIVSLAENLGVYRLVVFNFIPTGRGKEITSLDLTVEERKWLLDFLYENLQKRNLQVLSTSPLYAVVSVEKVLKGKGIRVTPTHFADVCIPSDSALILADFLGGCGAGRLYCGIQWNGDITPCVFLPLVVGNYREGFLRVWQENSVLKALRDRDDPEYACSECDYRYICGGCRARAYGYFGDVRGMDPGCFIRKNLTIVG
jgi:radical SAM protein with 4Fe4S-binding SPASM domain